MKEIINNCEGKIKGFSEKYEIPYNTVLQWTNETRKPPEWLKNIFKKLEEKENEI